MLYPENPVFSVITPTFKRAQLLKRNILSLKAQTFNDYEHIIVDDANDPETMNLVSIVDDPQIIYIKNSRQQGAAGAYNSGIIKSRGKFLLFLDDDDEYLPGFLEKMNTRFHSCQKEIGFIWAGIEKNEVNGKRTESKWPSVFSSKENAIVAAASIGNGFGVCVRRECIERIGLYDESLKVCSDTDFMIRLAQNYDCQTLNDVLVKIHKHANDQLTGKCFYRERISAWKIILDRHKDFFEKYPALASMHYSSLASLCYISGEKTIGRTSIFKAIRINPLRTRLYFDLIALELTGKNVSQTGFGIGIKEFFNPQVN